MGSFQLLFSRSVVAVALILIWLNKDLKRITYDETIGQHDAALVFRSLQSSWSNIIKTAASKYISLTIISMFASLGPPIAVALAYCFLREKLKAGETVTLILQLIAVMFVVFGASALQALSSSSLELNIKMEHVMYFLQFMNAFTSAGGSIAMRKMKSFHVSVISWYSDWMILISSLFMILFYGKGLKIFYSFDSMSWLLLLFNGTTAVAFNVCRF